MQAKQPPFAMFVSRLHTFFNGNALESMREKQFCTFNKMSVTQMLQRVSWKVGDHDHAFPKISKLIN